jgi:hypothetical protein
MYRYRHTLISGHNYNKHRGLGLGLGLDLYVYTYIYTGTHIQDMHKRTWPQKVSTSFLLIKPIFDTKLKKVVIAK